uniref:Tetraspanin 31 n=1 Tax=Sinocyclocheilus rhinocerous TaxID=307959 RepID=A0A673LX01_9TELE
MVCGGFTCSKNALCSLNVVYMLVGLLLIVVAAWGKGFGIVSSIHIIGFLTRCLLFYIFLILFCASHMDLNGFLLIAAIILQYFVYNQYFCPFSQILGVWLAMRYRNQKDPRANPSAFL